MAEALLGVVKQGHIDLLQPADLPDGTRVLVTLVPCEDDGFWRDASQTSLAAIWGNEEDDVYAGLLDQ